MNMFCFGESLRLPGLGSEELQALCQKLEQQVPKPAQLGHVAPATAQPKLTDNSAATYSSSGSARVDLFFKCEAGQLDSWSQPPASDSSNAGSDDMAAGSNGLDTILSQAWQEDPLDTLKLIAHVRDIRDGKGEQKQFYSCVQWLVKHHPLTLTANLSQIVEVGYWKDLLEMLVRMCGRPENSMPKKLQTKSRKRGREGGVAKGSYEPLFKATPDPTKVEFLRTMRKKEFRKHLRSLKSEAEREEAKAQRAKQAAQKAEILKQAVKLHKANKKMGRREIVERLYTQDVTFQLLHVTVAKLFAEQLQKDVEAMKEGRSSDVSLAAKWAPTPARSHDQYSFIATSIAELLFPGKEHQQSGQSYADYISHIRGLYHKTVLAPLRRCLDITEVYMSANAWGDVRYPRVPSVCMRKNKDKFEKHDKERFQQYLDDVKSGKSKIASGALKPHELVHEAMQLARVPYGGFGFGVYGAMSSDESSEDEEVEEVDNGSDDMDADEAGPPAGLPLAFGKQGVEDSVAEEEKQAKEETKKEKEEADLKQQTMELQWKSYVSNLKKSGTLHSALAICDVSGSMSGQPMEVAVALGLLTAEVTAAPFNNLVCTFSASPVLHEVKGDKLTEKVTDLLRMQWDMNTDLTKVFDLILHRAITHNVAPEDMIQTLFIFSDMQFDQATGGQTNFHAAQASFSKEGYKLPKVVFWNLQGEGSGATPVTQNEQGAALVSGFSGQLLKLFMGGVSELEKFNPFNVMREAISVEKYSAWKVVD